MCRVALALVVGCISMASTAVAQTQALPADQLKKIKAATVFIKVSLGQFNWSGSGFVVHAAKDYGLIVTNEHVVSPPQDEDLPIRPGTKPRVSVVFNSGNRDEWSGRAEVLYANKADDLALLKVRAIKPIPDPLSLTGADKLPETTPVYVCGFPFGADLAEGDKNPEISIGAASVSSNRTGENGEVTTVQLNGALNPGNSGGPVVTQEGKLVGVAVRTLTGAGIGFAVPPALVRRAVHDVHFAPATATWVAGPPRKIRLESKIVDAVGRLKTVTASVAPSAGNAFKTRNADDVSKQTGAKSVTPMVSAAAGVVVTEFVPPAASHFWLQFVWTDVDGKTHRTIPEWIASEEVKPDAPAPPRPPTRPTPSPDVPKFATELPPTPKGQIDVDELNRIAPQKLGERFTVDVLTRGSSDGYGDGPSLSGYNRAHQMPAGLDFVIDAALAAEMKPTRFNGRYAAVRITGTVRRPPQRKGWELFVVDEIKLLAPDGGTVETISRKEKANPPAGVPRSDPDPVRPPRPVAVNRPPLPNEPFPFGNAETQFDFSAKVQAMNTTILGKRHLFSVVITGLEPGGFKAGEQGVPATHVIVRCPETSRGFAAVMFFIPTAMHPRLFEELAKQPNRQLPCVIEFQPVGLVQYVQGAGRADCIVTSIRLADVTNPAERITLTPEWSDEVKSAVKLAPSRPAPPPAMPLQPVPVGTPAVAESGGDWVWPLVGTVAIGSLVLTGLWWKIIGAKKPKRVAKSNSRREWDDDGNDDRPRRRSRRA